MPQIRTQCRHCGTVSYVEVPAEGYQKWRNGALIQDAMPELTSADREKLISGFCGPCWDEITKEEEE